MVVVTAASLNPTGYGHKDYCWLTTENYFNLSFIVPVALIILVKKILRFLIGFNFTIKDASNKREICEHEFDRQSRVKSDRKFLNQRKE